MKTTYRYASNGVVLTIFFNNENKKNIENLKKGFKRNAKKFKDIGVKNVQVYIGGCQCISCMRTSHQIDGLSESDIVISLTNDITMTGIYKGELEMVEDPKIIDRVADKERKRRIDNKKFPLIKKAKEALLRERKKSHPNYQGYR